MSSAHAYTTTPTHILDCVCTCGFVCVVYITTVKTAIYDVCGQRPPGLYDRNLCKDDFVQNSLVVS